MFSLTFLGHQGWLISTAITNLLIDPLLTESFGHGGLLGRIHPPRALDLAGFPAIDAVILSHEHDDHFDIPSINRLDRAIPIYLSNRSSSAAHELLRKLGFVVHPLEVEVELELGDLRYRSFVADHRGGAQGDEWDVFPFFVGDVGGHGSLYSSVDVAGRPASLPARPRVWAHAHNSTRTGFQRLGGASAGAESTDAALLAAAVLRRFAELEACVGAPRAALICGQGWSFFGERAWINHEAFPVGPEQLAGILAAASPGTHVAAPAPGFTLEFVAGELVAVHDRRSFIAGLPRERWPDRSFAPTDAPPDYAPASGRADFDELDALLVELEDFARYLYGTPVFCGLHSVPATLAGRRAAVCFSLRTDAGPGREVLRYEPSMCRFVRDPSGDPRAELVAGIECYAVDLLGFLRGELSPSGFCYAGRVRVWNHAPQRLWFSPHDLWTYGHPLRRPERAARLYRSLLAGEPTNPGRVRGRRR